MKRSSFAAITSKSSRVHKHLLAHPRVGAYHEFDVVGGDSMMDDLEKTLRRWEAAVSVCERDGDDSDTAVLELNQSREALLVLLRKALS